MCHIITGNSVINIRQRNEAIIIYFGKYYRIKKVHYYKDKVLAPIYKRIKQQNAEKIEIKKMIDDLNSNEFYTSNDFGYELSQKLGEALATRGLSAVIDYTTIQKNNIEK